MAQRIRKEMNTILHLPQDVVYSDGLVSCLGRSQVVIENYKSILFYTDNILKVQTKRYRIVIEGKNLRINYYNQEDLKVTGMIEIIHFE